MSFDALIDQFVERVNASQREPLFDEDAPLSVRISTLPGEANGGWEWRIKRCENINWVEELEVKLPRPFPKSFRSFIARYVFPQFDFGPMRFLANTPEGIEEVDELRTGIFQDRHLSAVLLQNGFIQFARVAGGGYDPVCFNVNEEVAALEHEIVVLDHERILCYDEIKITKILAPCFGELLIG